MKSNLKAGRFSGPGAASAVKLTQLFGGRDHAFKKQYINTSICLTKDDKYTGWMLSFKMILGEMKQVDSMLVFESVLPGLTQECVEELKYLPNNFTDLPATVKLSVNAKFIKSNHGATRRGMTTSTRMD